MALESRDPDEVIKAILQVARNCVQDDIDVTTLPLYEIEKLFLHLRARSMGEKITLDYLCNNVVSDKSCNASLEVEIDVLSVQESVKPVNSVIKIAENISIKLKYPNIEVSKMLMEMPAGVDSSIKLIEKCTEYLFDDEQVYKVEDLQDGEFNNFIENLTKDQFLQVMHFFDNVPKLVYDTQVTCGKCNFVHKIHIEGISDFFV
jgi:hypothetical protein